MSVCGGCTLCCTLMAVEELGKGPCEKCKFVEKRGCGIYSTRPNSCKAFECLWYQSQSRPEPMPKWMRPDRCGVVIVGVDENTIALNVDPARPEVLMDKNLMGIVGGWSAQGLQVVGMVGPRKFLVKLEPKPVAPNKPKTV